MYEYELVEDDIAQICRLTNINSLIYEEPFDSTAKETNVSQLNNVLSSLTRLNHLTLGLWHEHQVDLRHLTRLANLQSLEIDVTANVSLVHFDSLSYLTQLTHFTFYAPVLPSVPGETFSAAMKWPRMRSLALILKTNVDLAPLSQYTQLVDLELQSLSLTDEYLTFHAWTNLTRLHLTCSRATAESFTKLGLLTDLRELTITKNGHVKDLLWITSLVNLRKLNFGHTKISDTDIELLAALPHLEVLNICGCRSTSSQAVKTLGKMTNLKQLNISESGILFSSRRVDILDALSGAVDLLIANDVHGPSDLGWE
jgi:Leucine-rich repeat (LRR) protein